MSGMSQDKVLKNHYSSTWISELVERTLECFSYIQLRGMIQLNTYHKIKFLPPSSSSVQIHVLAMRNAAVKKVGLVLGLGWKKPNNRVWKSTTKNLMVYHDDNHYNNYIYIISYACCCQISAPTSRTNPEVSGLCFHSRVCFFWHTSH